MKAGFFLLFTLINTVAYARLSRTTSQPCEQKLDSAQAVAKVIKKYDPPFTPSIEFDSSHCTWVIHFSTTSYTKKGKCRHTNGCTVWTDYVARVNAKGKMRVKRLESKVYPNYE
jgi:hypothetical protein